MPCYDSRNEPDYVRAEARKEFQADLDKLTRLLCAAMHQLEETYQAQFGMEASEELRSDVGIELWQWWKKHKELDKKARAGPLMAGHKKWSEIKHKSRSTTDISPIIIVMGENEIDALHCDGEVVVETEDKDRVVIVKIGDF